MRRSSLLVAVSTALILAVPAVAYAATAATADLPAPTSTTAVTGPGTGSGDRVLTGVRTGRHDDYDRTVFDFTGGTPGYRVEYGTLTGQGTGDPIPIAGAATLTVVFDGLANPAVDMRTVYNPQLPTLLQIKSGGYFEGYATFGLGLNDRVGFRVLVLHGPDRIAVDVAHQPSQPFSSNPYSSDGTAPDAVVAAVRSGSHPGYDRLVLDMQGPLPSDVDVAYLGSGSTLRITVRGSGSATTSPHASYSGPGAYTFNLPALKSLQFTIVGAGVMYADVPTAARHGFRVLQLTDPTRIAVDVAY
jgi:hypothetical protein